jgi:radical SAM superfamily enzyme YgiQ (UPF0313 family)
MDQAKEFFRALVPLKIRWVSQASINAAHDEEFLQLIKASGCQGLLIGFETLNPENLRQMGKSFNTMKGGYEKALENLRRHSIRLYVTFILGYDEDHGDTLRETLAFAERHRFYIVAFNHLTPFPGTPLYQRLQQEGRLLYDRWWLDPEYRYGMVPFTPRGMTAGQVKERCIEARQVFYGYPSIFRRGLDLQVNGRNFFMWTHFFRSICCFVPRSSSGKTFLLAMNPIPLLCSGRSTVSASIGSQPLRCRYCDAAHSKSRNSRR